MNRKQKIIVSITGIFLVLLALVGLTYAYFLTRITGNENEKSISVTTANLELVYGDGNGILKPYGVISPGMDIQFLDENNPNDITDDEIVNSKTFTVTNNGNGKVEDYGVILEKLIITYASDVEVDEDITIPSGTVTTLNSSSDFEIKITCTSSVSGNTCEGFEGTLADASNVLLTNDIAVSEVHTYTLTMKYLETGENQSADMNKTLSAKINIIDTKDTVDLKGIVISATEGSYIETETTTIVEQTSNDKNVSPSYLDGTNTSHIKQIDNENETKRSYVDKDGNYSILGLKPGAYKIKYHNSKSKLTSEVTTINIVKGEEASISGDTITITDSSRSFDLSVDSDTLVGTLGTEVEESTSGNNPFTKGTLAYTIVNNALKGQGGRTVFSETTLSPLSTTGGANADEKILSIAEDDYTETTGNMSYYFRGNVTDNYVTFNNMCWRVVRVQGDGSVKLLLADLMGGCSDQNNDGLLDSYVSDSLYNSSLVNSESVPFNSNNFLKNTSITYPSIEDEQLVYKPISYTKFNEYYLSLIKNEYYSSFKDRNGYYISNSYTKEELEEVYGYTENDYVMIDGYYYFEYDPCYNSCFPSMSGWLVKRIFIDKSYTLKTSKINYVNIGTLLADEIIYAGNNTSYLTKEGDLDIILNESDISSMFYGGDLCYVNGKFSETCGDFVGSRPVITLIDTVTATGEGTIDNPYVIN